MTAPLTAASLTAAAGQTAPPTWELIIAETRTGAVVRELPVADGTTPSWERGVNGRGKLSAQVPIYSDMISRGDLRELISAGDRYSLAWCLGSWVTQAGPITQYSPNRAEKIAESTVTVECSGIWGLVDDRPIGAANTADWVAAAADTTFGPLSWRTIVKRLLEQMETWPDSDLPLVYETDVAGTHTITYPGYELGMVGERIHQITQRQDGCDVELRPRLSADRTVLEWLVVTGDPYLGQSGSPHAWASGSDLVSVSPVVDVTAWASDWIVTGQGTERGRLIRTARTATRTAGGAPRRWRVIGEHASVTETATLDSYAAAYAEMYSAPVENWRAIVNPNAGGPDVSGVSPGDDALFMVAGEPWLPDGDYRRRIIDLGSGPERDQIVLTLAPVPARF